MKKTFALLISLMMILSLAVTAFAAETKLEVETKSAKVGDEITVSVSTKNNSGIAYLAFTVDYDTTKLQFTGYEESGMTSWVVNTNKVVFVWSDTADYTGIGEILKLKFKVLDNAESGFAKIALTDISAFDVNEAEVNCSFISGGVTVSGVCKHTNTELRNKKDATCKEEGYSGDTYCLDCNTTISTGRQLPKDTNNHVGGTEVKNAKKATCKEEGYTGDTCCKGCGAVIAQGKSIAKDADNHTGNTEIRNKQEANCVDKGNTGDTYCKDCNKLIKAGEVSDLNKDNHKDLKVINKKDATCKEEGYTGDTHCEACGYTAQGEVIPKTENHKFGAWKVTKEPTNTEEGEKERTCSVCGKVETAKIAKVSSNSDPIHVNVNGNANKDEINPNTGAEAVCGVVVTAAVVSGALWIASRKRH